MCAVLRCPATSNPGRVRYGPVDEGAPIWEAAVCAEHKARIDSGEPWSWVDEDRAIVMGDDLDSGGFLTPTGWVLNESMGRSELRVECTTPSGKPHEPVKFLLDDEQRTTIFAAMMDHLRRNQPPAS